MSHLFVVHNPQWNIKIRMNFRSFVVMCRSIGLPSALVDNSDLSDLSGIS